MVGLLVITVTGADDDNVDDDAAADDDNVDDDDNAGDDGVGFSSGTNGLFVSFANVVVISSTMPLLLLPP